MKNNIISKIITFAMTTALCFTTVPFQASAYELATVDIESNEEIVAEADEAEIIEITQQLSMSLYDSNSYDGYSYSFHSSIQIILLFIIHLYLLQTPQIIL